MNSFHNAISAMQFGNPSAIGQVTSVTLSQYDTFGITVTWGYSPTYNPDLYPAEYAAVCQDTSFGIYLNGRLQQIQPGNIRSANIVAPNADTQEVEVIAWPSMYQMPDTYYAGVGTRRAHIDWDASTATDIAGYVIYHDTSASPTTEYARQTTVAVDGASFDFGSGASAVISGVPGPAFPSYTNCTFTVTITDATTGTAELANSVDATTVVFTYMVGQPVAVLDGIVIVISETPVTDDALDFSVRIVTYYDTAPLDAGTHYFAIASVDTAGNLSDPTADVVVTITPPPAPVTEWEVGYDTDDNKVTYSVTQSSDGVSVNVYSNYDQSTNTLMDEVYYTAPLLTITVASSAINTGVLLTDMLSKPEGDYIFAARAVSASNIESDDTTTDMITIPYIADEPNVVSAEIVQDGSDFTLTWISDGIPSDSTWLISGDNGFLSLLVLSAPEELSGAFYQYSATTSVPTDTPTYTFTIKAAVIGPPFDITYTFDTVAPDTPGNPTGTAY